MDSEHMKLSTLAALAQDVAAALGKGRAEAVYQKALGVAMQAAGIPHVMEETVPILFRGQAVGQERIDVTVHDYVSALLEIKAIPGKLMKPDNVWQLQSYMRAKNVRYGLLINFSQAPGQPLEVCVFVEDKLYDLETFELTDLPSSSF